jgi:hypothetical protein
MKREIKEARKKLVRRKGVVKLVPNWVGGPSHEEIPPAEVLERNLKVQDLDATSQVAPHPTIVSWCAPARVFTPVTEPIFLVHGLGKASVHPDRVFEWDEVKRMEDSISVHTKTLTVLDQIDKKIRRKKNIYEDQEKVPKIPIQT